MVALLVLLLLPGLPLGTETISLRLWSADTQTCYDYSRHDNHAVSGSTSALEAGVDVLFTLAGAVFLGSGSVLTLPPNGVTERRVEVDAEFTMAIWLWPEVLQGTIIERVAGTSSLFGVKLVGNNVEISVMDIVQSFNFPTLIVNSWFLLSVTVTSTVVASTLYVSLNNVSLGPFNYPAPFQDSADSSFRIGASTLTGAIHFQGVIYEFRWFDTALTASALSDLYALPGTPCPNCSTICSVNPVAVCIPDVTTIPAPIPAPTCSFTCSPTTLTCEIGVNNACFYTGASCAPTCFTCFSSLASGCDTCLDSNAVLTLTGGGSPGGSCTCASGFYAPSTGGCSPCYYGCLTCSDSADTNCLSCQPPITLSATFTCACPVSQYMSTQGICKVCMATCSICSGDTAADCTGCWPNSHILDGALVGPCVCSGGFYGSAENCLQCDPVCLECSGPGDLMCTSCKTDASLIGTQCQCNPGSYPSSDPSNCLPCDSPCSICLLPGLSSCRACKSNAQLSSPPTSTCICSPGFYPDLDPSKCVQCSQECKSCSGFGASQCMECKDHAGLVAGPPGACNCVPGYAGAPDACQSCHATCSTCSTTFPSGCETCKSNAELLGGTAPDSCVCSSGFYASPSAANCQVCDSTCAKCVGPGASGCSDCFPPGVLSGSTCVCPLGYFPNTTTQFCSQCYLSCQTCTGPGQYECSSCKDPLVLPAAGLCPCASSQFLLASGLCGNCHSSCPSCSAAELLDCESCYSHASFNPTQGCLCDNGFAGAPQACVQCEPFCLTCSVPSICLSCKANAHILPTNLGICTCVSGFFPNPNAGSCSACDISCLECALGDSSSCLQCYPNAQLSTSMPSPCVCLTGYVAWPSISSCTLCHPTCLKCTAPGVATNCLECYSNAELQELAPNVCSCRFGFYPSPAASTCVECPGLCSSCNDAISGCLSCKPDSALQGINCRCQPGFHLSLSQTMCEMCHSSCLTCANSRSQDCLSCSSHSSLSSTAPSSCLCDPGYMRQGLLLQCQPVLCDIRCTACSSAGTCLGCFSNADIRANSQICTCKDGYFPDPNASNCSRCDNTCRTCASNAPISCLSCLKGARLKYSLMSECECKPEHYPDPDASQCSKCPPNCLVCSSSRSCAQCSIGYFPSGQMCHRCLEHCLQCPDSQTCQVCALPAYLTLSQQCKVCPTCPLPLHAQVFGPFEFTYNVTFTRPVQTEFHEGSLKVSTVPTSEIGWKVGNEGNLTVTIEGGPWANISLVSIAILVPVWDEFGFYLENTEFEANPPSDAASDSLLSASFLKTSVQVTTALSLSVALGSTVLTGGGLGLALLSQMQYFSYVGKSDFSITGSLSSFYLNLNQKSLLPNWLQRESSAGRRLSSAEELLELEDFLDSAGQYLTLLVGIGTVHAVVGMASLVLGKWVERLKVGFVWGVYLWFWYFAYLDLLVSALLHLKTQYTLWASLRSVASNILALLTLILACVTPILTCYIVPSNRAYLFRSAENAIKGKFAALVPAVRADLRRAQFFIPIYYFQRLIYAVLIVFLRDLSRYQALSFLFPCGIMFLFASFCRPLIGKLSQIIHIISEIDTISVFSLLCYSVYQPSSASLTLNWVIFAFTVKAFLCTVALALIHILRVVKRLWKRSKQVGSQIHTETLFDNRASIWTDEGKGGSEEYQKGETTQRSDLAKD